MSRVRVGIYAGEDSFNDGVCFWCGCTVLEGTGVEDAWSARLFCGPPCMIMWHNLMTRPWGQLHYATGRMVLIGEGFDNGC